LLIKQDIFFQPELQIAFDQHAEIMHASESTVLMEPGQYLQFIPIVISGCIRVLRQNKDGDETFLYHVMPGETCALSLTCCTAQRPSEVRAIAEEDTSFWAVPIRFVEDWQEYKEWKSFIAVTYQNRFNKLLEVIDDIAFKHMDQRLWSYLRARSTAKQTSALKISHEEIAKELNIQREAATRLLKKLKDTGYIETGRNEIRMLKK
jgi:CRP/FNR family transcriptional regulator, anaerobic regulatory protein